LLPLREGTEGRLPELNPNDEAIFEQRQ